MKIIENWRKAYKWYSVHILLLFTIMPAVWEAIPHEWRDAIPPNVLAILASVMGAAGVLARLTSQEKKPDVDSTQSDNQ